MYTKPYLTFEQQVERLQMRGLKIGDKELAKDVLASVNYYRFSGYADPFFTRHEVGEEKSFKEGVEFSHVVQVIRLDEKLRDLLAVALEWIEIDFRTTFAHEHSRIYGAMGYMDSRNFFDAQKHDDVQRKVSDIINPPNNRPREVFIEHLMQKYGEVPVWSMVEVIPFGTVVHMYRNMHRADKFPVAKRYMFHKGIFDSYIKHILVVRNMCAHHTRIWDKKLYGLRPFPGLPDVDWSVIDTRRIFYTLLLICRITRHIPKDCFDRDKWKNELLGLLKDFQELSNCNTSKIMGIPENGFEQVWWV